MLYRRGKQWWIAITTGDGRRIRRSSGTSDKRQAQEFHDRLKAETWRQTKLGDEPRHTWQEAVVEWSHRAKNKKTYDRDVHKLGWWHEYLGNTYLDQISRDMIEAGARDLEQDGLSPATVNRYLAVVKTILRMAAHEWGWLQSTPRIQMRREPRGRDRALTREQAEMLIAELPRHLGLATRFALETGMRETNQAHLVWTQIDPENCTVHLPDTKNGEPLTIPLSAIAIDVLRECITPHASRVFTLNGLPLDRFSNSAWYRALKRVGLKDFRWHDLRHTWASWHAQKGTPLHVIQLLGGWKTTAMVQRYAHHSVESLRSYL